MSDCLTEGGVAFMSVFVKEVWPRCPVVLMKHAWPQSLFVFIKEVWLWCLSVLVQRGCGLCHQSKSEV